MSNSKGTAPSLCFRSLSPIFAVSEFQENPSGFRLADTVTAPALIQPFKGRSNNSHLKECLQNLINGAGSTSVCLVDLTKVAEQKGGSAITVIYDTMDHILVSGPISLGSLAWVSKAVQQLTGL
ncbi:hypothetical protein Nepgr_000321 [Nepenthes gracilis]|uniref:Uncharacterized protein n=1 Tax=Nepenthes gracilis TaxID=150966 RepID=A0AAD3P3N5_NEPGR|nr:hypothetical protein Nepgr_000321 [Nepenthes gracilis]